MNRFFLVLLPLLLSSYCLSQSVKVLYVGNSYTSVNNLPQLITDLALSTSDTIFHDQSTLGGARFLTHTANAGTQAKIKADEWDYVVLQAQSQEPSFPDASVEVDLFPYAKELCDSIRSNHDCSQALFYMTWGRENGDADNCGFFEPLCTYEGMDSMLNLRYRLMAEMNTADLSPVGAVWRYLRENHPEIQLYSGDGSHPAFAGSYAAACAFYTLILQKDPSLIADDKGIPEETAIAIRMAAKVVAFDQLEMWRQADVLPNSEFSFELDSLEVSFQAVTETADSYLWDFGDGNFSNEPTVSHAYPAPTNGEAQTYICSLTVTTCGVSSSSQLNVIVAYDDGNMEGTALADRSDVQWDLHPNPASEKLLLSNLVDLDFTLSIYNSKGQLFITMENPQEIDLSDFAKGIYFFRLKENKGSAEFTKRILVD